MAVDFVDVGGATSYTVPTGEVMQFVYTWGAGGGAHAGSGNNGGGGGGGSAKTARGDAAGVTFFLAVGAGSGGAGGDSSIWTDAGHTNLICKGVGGAIGGLPGGGAGGGGTGDSTFTGGTGGTGNSTQGGGGGSGADATVSSNGNNGATPTGGASVGGQSGKGGDGGNGSGQSGANGNTYGGGGGGGSGGTTGQGANGRTGFQHVLADNSPPPGGSPFGTSARRVIYMDPDGIILEDQDEIATRLFVPQGLVYCRRETVREACLSLFNRDQRKLLWKSGLEKYLRLVERPNPISIVLFRRNICLRATVS